MGLLDMFVKSDRLKNVLLGILNTLLLLGIFLLGFNAANWTNEQIKDYCSIEWCRAAQMNNYQLGEIGNSSFSNTSNLTDIALNWSASKYNSTIWNLTDES
jgi:hypothetical protein